MIYIASEQDINSTLSDFMAFCNFIEERKPILSKRNEVLGKNDLFELNNLLKFRKDVDLPKFQQESYPIIDLMFNLAQLGKLHIKNADAKGNVYLEATSRRVSFDALNSFEKYSFLFETFWTQYDFMEILRFSIDTIHEIIQTIAKSRPEQKLIKGAFSKREAYDPVFSYNAVLVNYFSFFGFCSFVPIVNETKKLTRHDDNIKEVIPNEFGIHICNILISKNITQCNIPWLEVYGIYDEHGEYDSKPVPLFRSFEPIFPKGVLLHTVKNEIKKVVKCNYTFKVSLEKNVWRKIKLSHKDSLEDLHLAIQQAFEFDNDHLYAFFMDGKRYSRNAYHSPRGDEGPFTDEAIIGKLDLYVGQKILYYFDYGDSWEFAVQLLTIDENEPPLKKPMIIEIKGDAPEQYELYEEDEEEY